MRRGCRLASSPISKPMVRLTNRRSLARSGSASRAVWALFAMTNDDSVSAMDVVKARRISSSLASLRLISSITPL